MTPAQVAGDRAEFARAEASRIEATLARELALKELEEKTGQPYTQLLDLPPAPSE